MGFWDVGPFDNDDAADFAMQLDQATVKGRITLVSSELAHVVDTTDPEIWNAPRGIAAAALVAAQCPGGQPTDPVYGPSEPMPRLPDHLKGLAIEALDRATAAPSWLADFWEETSQGAAWRRTITNLRKVLDPPQPETPFDL
ncbi:DUF4259 domain-containing protein [Micromonospora echinospora]|uniref:DUF4259 domain-containing protein n=1 Tax=Micromonospora echinospora TaxID=1877 RepID=UPI0037A3370D